jgi:hypothetical protein
MYTALEYSTRVVQEGGRRCKKSTLNDLVHLTPLRIPLMNPPNVSHTQLCTKVYGALCVQINNSKLCILRQISKGKFKAIKKLYIG